MLQVLWLERWHPTTLNTLMAGHWAKGHRKKKLDGEVVAAECLRHGLRPAQGPRKVSLHLIVPPKARRCDRDAFWKVALDCLKRAGAIVDDSPNYCTPGAVTYSRSESAEHWGTLVYLEDV